MHRKTVKVSEIKPGDIALDWNPYKQRVDFDVMILSIQNRDNSIYCDVVSLDLRDTSRILRAKVCAETTVAIVDQTC